jgi:5-carboxymethyl-2-hydroxymuconate isomerase
MPHLTLEYTANLRERRPDATLFSAFHSLLESVAGIKIENCKSRWREVDDWVVGNGKERSAFVHLDVRFMEGRTDELKQALGIAFLEMLKACFDPGRSKIDLQITVEIQDIRKADYFKDPPGTLGPPPTTMV